MPRDLPIRSAWEDAHHARFAGEFRSLTATWPPKCVVKLVTSITRRTVQQVRTEIARSRRVGQGFRPCFVLATHATDERFANVKSR
jgi:hypothetical protein